LKKFFMVLSLLTFTFSTFYLSDAKAHVAQSNEAPFIAHVKIDYQVGLRHYVMAIDQKVEFSLGKLQEIIVRFKDSNRLTKLGITILSYHEDDNLLEIAVSRQDFRNNEPYSSRSSEATFNHVIGDGTSVIKLGRQDPLSSGSFRFRLDF
jgi:hypothetical protein